MLSGDAMLLIMARMTVIFSAEQAAAALWAYGEDGLIDRALAIADADLPRLWEIAGDYWEADNGLPLRTRLVLDKVTAFAAITFLEGRVRPLTQERRRPRTSMPQRLRDARAVDPGIRP